MDESAPTHGVRVAFDRFVFDAGERVLSCAGVALPLPPKVLETLAILIESAGRIVDKQVLRASLWPQGFVEDGNLTQNIYLLRRTLDPSGDGRAYIETVPRRGYRFVAALARDVPAAPAPARSVRFAHSLRALAALLLLLAFLGIGGERARAPISAAAARAYALGRFYWNQRTAHSLQRAEAYFKETIRLAPGSPLGYDGVADTHLVRAQSAERPAMHTELALARRFRDAALRRDADSPEAHTTSAFIDYYFRHDHAAARREFGLALAGNPNQPTAHQWYAIMLMSEGNIAAATHELEVANAIDPTAEVVARWLGIAYYFGRRPADAQRLLHQSLDLVPSDGDALLELSYVEEQGGRFTAALATLDRIAGEHPHLDAYLAVARANVELAAHCRPPAPTLSHLARLAAGDHIDFAGYALVLDGLGRRAEAFTWLRKMRRDPLDIAFLRLDPRLDPLRSDPRFARILGTAFT